MSYAAKIIADSMSQYTGNRLTTFEITFPRYILAEFNTHRAISRSSASSRAIPVKKQIERIINDPFIPIHWGKNQSGMQAETELDANTIEDLTDEWLNACDNAVSSAQRLISLGLHKQVANRILEPFMWHTVICSATDWSNFFALRANEMADPHIQVVAKMMQKLYNENEPNQVGWYGWHLPLTGFEGDEDLDLEDLKKVSVARSARVSYLTHNGTRDIDADLTLYNRLLESRHLSPFEHVAQPATGRHGNFNGWKSIRQTIPNESDFSLVKKEESV